MKTIVFVFAAFVFANAAFANPPDPGLSNVDHVIISSWNNVPAANGLAPCSASPAGFDVWVRDFAGNPVGSAQVKVTFAGTGTAIRPYKPQGPQGPITIHCIDRSMSGFTDGQGRLNFTPHFGRYAETNVVEVTADGVVLALIQARSPDYDCDGDVDLVDLSTFAGDYTDTQYHPRSDFDDCPTTTLGDLSFFVNQYLASSNSGVPIDVCP